MIDKEWRPKEWPDAHEFIFLLEKAGTMLSTTEVFELGASTLLVKIVEEVKQKNNIDLLKMLK